DSFSDGGLFLDPQRAVNHALEMIYDGAAIIDIGGESTRPGAKSVDHDEQIKRVIPVISGICKQSNTPVSIDATDHNVARAALDAGASIINDISALRFDPEMIKLAKSAQVPVIIMHMLGTPRDMQTSPTYLDVVAQVKNFLAERLDFAVQAGVERSQIVIDPGIGFGKTVQHNLLLLKHLDEFHQLQAPLLVGPSRKSFIGKVLELDDPADRLYGTMGVAAHCVASGAQIIRVHDVKQIYHVVKIIEAIQKA
ncbi:MAG: dihydropteroate synthase, partial [Planctomycetes bacterium]|nr:dihydropteroate synthase [Planctomycetota bacterium]